MSKQTVTQSAEDVKENRNKTATSNVTLQYGDTGIEQSIKENVEGGPPSKVELFSEGQGTDRNIDITWDEDEGEEWAEDGESAEEWEWEGEDEDEGEEPPKKKYICRKVRIKRRKTDITKWEGEVAFSQEDQVEKEEEKTEKTEATETGSGEGKEKTPMVTSKTLDGAPAKELVQSPSKLAVTVELEGEGEEEGEEGEGKESEEESTETTECVTEVEEEPRTPWDNMAEDEYGFLLLTDPGIYEALELREMEQKADMDGVQAYLDMCKAYGITPVKSLLTQLLSGECDLKYYGASAKNIRSLAVVLKYNPHVKRLVLSENPLDAASVFEIAELIRENITLEAILLNRCKIGASGAAVLAETLPLSQTLKHLDLSNNDLGDEGLIYLAEGIGQNSSLEILDLSHNKIGMQGAKALAQALKEDQNTTLRDVRLSWNRLFEDPEKGLKPLLAYLRTDEQALERLDLAWNALGEKSAPFVGTLMVKAPNLAQLRIDHNRFPDSAAPAIRRGLAQSPTLEVLHAGFNPMTSAAAYTLISAAKEPLRVLDLDGITVKKDFLNVKAKKEDILVVHGEPLSIYTIPPPDMAKIMLDRARFEGFKPKKKKQQKDFGHLLLELEKDEIQFIPGDEFFQKVKAKKIKVRDELIRGLAEQFQNKKKKKVDVKEMLDKYMSLYPDTVLPPPKEKKKKKKKGKGKGKGKGKKKEAA